MNLRNKNVLITGGGSGIGLAITQAMVEAGARVIITGRNPKKLEAVVRDLPTVTGRVCDVTDEVAVIALRDALLAEGGIDVLINNAGIFNFINLLDAPPLAEHIEEIEIDVVGPIRMIHHFLPSMLEREAMIINVSSGLAYVPYAATPVYSGAKAFIHFYTLCLREQLKGTSIKVVELLPPVVDTPLAKGIESPFAPMPPARLAAALMKGLQSSKSEITPGISALLKWMGRLLPGFAFQQLNKQR